MARHLDGRANGRGRRHYDHAMTSPWEDFARSDPQFYIDPTLSRGADAGEFLEGGRGIVERMLEWAGELSGRDRALDIGCGLGRDTVHLAAAFARVDGVDVAPTMIRTARERGLPDNVRLHVASGRDLQPLPSASYDFVFSHLVFQHVAEEAVIAGYLREIARVLVPGGGVAVVQFDTRPPSLLADLAHRVPDALLPRSRRRGMRRHRRPPARIRTLAGAAGLTLDGELDPGTAQHWLRCRARAAPGSL
jgi:SAM-dependent methyltransferase